MKKMNEVYVITDGEQFYDADGYMYNLSVASVDNIGFSKEDAQKVCDNLNKSAYDGKLKVAKVEFFAKIS